MPSTYKSKNIMHAKTESIKLSDRPVYISEQDRMIQRPIFIVKIIIDEIDTKKLEAFDGITFEPHFRIKPPVLQQWKKGEGKKV